MFITVVLPRGDWRVSKFLSKFLCTMSETSSKPTGNIRPIPSFKKIKNKLCMNKPTATAYLQVFGTGSADTSPSVYLFADSQRHIGRSHRSSKTALVDWTRNYFPAVINPKHWHKYNNHSIDLDSMNFFPTFLDTFLAVISWDLIGGLPGLLLTLRDTGKTTLGVHGPSNLSQFLKSTRSFVLTQNVDLNCTDYTGSGNEQFEDENIIVWPIYLEGKETDNFSYNSEITEIQEESEVDKAVNEEQTNMQNDKNIKQKAFGSELDPNPKRCKLDIDPKPVVNYICQLVQMPGKMNIKKAIALGVPNGPVLGQLQKGQIITLENGSVVKPEDVIEQSSKGCVFCIIDCPNKHYFDKLISSKQLITHETGGSNMQPTIMIHLSPAVMVEMPEYINWTRRFGSSCQHLFLNSAMSAPKIAMLSQLRIQYKLHQLDPDIFPRLFASDTPKVEIRGDLKQNWKAGECFLMYHLRPAQKIGYDYSDIKTKWDKMAEKLQDKNLSSITEIIQPNISIKEFMDPDNFVHRESDNLVSTTDGVLNNKLKDDNFGIVFLGTGASIPSKYRNVSSTLVNISKEKVMLLDCGEGTYGQLYRHYGPDLKTILLKLCCVFISHIHADHHLGLIRVLQAWQNCVETLPKEDKPDPVLVVGPPSLLSWLRSYGTFYETLHLRFLDCFKCQNNSFVGYKTLSSVLEAEKVTIVPVIHCYHAFGLVLTHKHGWKLVYSGDTRPCNDLVKEGLGATVLIHEATFEDDLCEEAIAKSHCTTTEAIQCGQEMKAEFILLNHFSQRYPKIPVFNEKFNGCTGIAFDHMKVNFKNIASVSKLLGPLQEIFKEEIPEQKDEIADERSDKTT